MRSARNNSIVRFEPLEIRRLFATEVALPDLVPLIDGGSFAPYTDKTSTPGRVLLRFGTTFGNIGSGPLILTADADHPNADGTETVRQSLFSYDTIRNKYAPAGERIAGDFIYHPEHEHFHFDGYASYQLYRSRRGVPYRPAKRDDGAAVSGEKVSFCLSDGIKNFTIPGGSRRSKNLLGYTASGQPEVGCGLTQGLHVGMADSYDASIEGQWVDVTGVVPGDYFLIVKLDADNVIAESDETNNTITVRVKLESTSALHPAAIKPDRYESSSGLLSRNDSPEAASPLGAQGTSTIGGLTLDSSVDQDWFAFKAVASGRHSIRTICTDGEADLYLFDDQGRHLVQSTIPQNGGPLHPAIQTVSYNFVAGETYKIKVEGYVGDGRNGMSRDYGLKIDLPSRASVLVGRPVAIKRTSSWASVNFFRKGPTDTPLTVRYRVTGTARAGVDYTPLSGVIRFSVGSAQRTLHIYPAAQDIAGDATSLIIALIDGEGYVTASQQRSVTLAVV